jgi:cytochrome bd-type quinol oxidase subunit 2
VRPKSLIVAGRQSRPGRAILPVADRLSSLLRGGFVAQCHGDRFTHQISEDDMTTTTASTSTPSRTPLIAVLGFATSAVLTAIGTYWDINNNDAGNNDGFAEYASVLGIAAVVTALVFGLVVRTAPNGYAGRRSAILGVLAALTIVVFWTGAPPVLAAGAIATALVERDVTGRLGNGSKTGLALACVATAAAVLLAIVG